MATKVKKASVAELLAQARVRMDSRTKPEDLGFPCAWGSPITLDPSRDGYAPRYRYTLWRHMGGVMTGRSFPGRLLMVVGLNPSTADAEQDDPTLRRVQGFAREWGYDSVCMTNAYAYRATDPRAMFAAHLNAVDIVGPENDVWLERIARVAQTILVAWGSNIDRDREESVRQLLLHASGKNGAGLMCLGTTNAGHPRHPLYLAARTPLQPWVRP